MCNCCGDSYQPNKVGPHKNSVVTAQYGRVNGWSCPWNPLQIVGWFLLILFAVTHFAILVHYLPLEWTPAGVIVSNKILMCISVSKFCIKKIYQVFENFYLSRSIHINFFTILNYNINI